MRPAPKLAARLENATLMEGATTTGNYAYDSKFCRGDRFMMVGDAYAFVDPMFSSGVYLAMNSAFEGATAAASVTDLSVVGVAKHAAGVLVAAAGLQQALTQVLRVALDVTPKIAEATTDAGARTGERRRWRQKWFRRRSRRIE